MLDFHSDANILAGVTAEQPDYWKNSFPDLTHTRLRSVRVDGRAVHRPNWGSLHRELVDRFLQTEPAAALFRLGLREVIFAQTSEHGCVYNRSKHVSVRKCSTNVALRNIAKMAEVLGVSLDVTYIHPRDRHDLQKLTISL